MRCADCRFWLDFHFKEKTGECARWNNVEDKRLTVCAWDWDCICVTADFGCVAFEPHAKKTEAVKTSVHMELLEAFDRCLRQWRMHIEENNQDDLESLAQRGCLEAEMCLECFDVYDRETSEQAESPSDSPASPVQHNYVIEYMQNAAKSYRDKLPSGEASPQQTYKGGFDVGYALGHAHAFEEVLKRFSPTNKNFVSWLAE